MTDHLAVLEKVYRRMKEGEFYGDYDEASALLREFREAISAIALMCQQSERPRAYFCPLDTGPGMLMHNDETAANMIAYFAPKGQVFIPLYEGQPLPAPPKQEPAE